MDSCTPVRIDEPPTCSRDWDGKKDGQQLHAVEWPSGHNGRPGTDRDDDFLKE